MVRESLPQGWVDVSCFFRWGFSGFLFPRGDPDDCFPAPPDFSLLPRPPFFFFLHQRFALVPPFLAMDKVRFPFPRVSFEAHVLFFFSFPPCDDHSSAHFFFGERRPFSPPFVVKEVWQKSFFLLFFSFLDLVPSSPTSRAGSAMTFLSMILIPSFSSSSWENPFFFFF